MTRYMTRQGYDAIQAEITELWHGERPRIVKEVQDAADLGDRSENGAYIYGKKRLRQIDSRLRYLSKKLDEVTVVDLEKQPPSDKVKFGARVVVEDAEGEQRVYRLVDKDESDPKRGRISVQSPVGRSLLGKEEGDTVLLKLPKKNVELEVLEVQYGAGEP